MSEATQCWKRCRTLWGFGEIKQTDLSSSSWGVAAEIKILRHSERQAEPFIWPCGHIELCRVTACGQHMNSERDSFSSAEQRVIVTAPMRSWCAACLISWLSTQEQPLFDNSCKSSLQNNHLFLEGLYFDVTTWKHRYKRYLRPEMWQFCTDSI